MALDLAKITQNAVGAATKAKAAATCTITRPAPPQNPLNGSQSGSSFSQTAPAIPTDTLKIERSLGGAWSEAKVALFVPLNDTTFTPLINDQCTYAGQTMRIVAVHIYAPGGTGIAYLIGMGA